MAVAQGKERSCRLRSLLLRPAGFGCGEESRAARPIPDGGSVDIRSGIVGPRQPETRFLNVQFPSPRPPWNVGFLAEYSNANNHCKGADSGESAHNTRLYGNGGSEAGPRPIRFKTGKFRDSAQRLSLCESHLLCEIGVEHPHRKKSGQRPVRETLRNDRLGEADLLRP
jgi:hypothetical protein